MAGGRNVIHPHSHKYMVNKIGIRTALQCMMVNNYWLCVRVCVYVYIVNSTSHSIHTRGGTSTDFAARVRSCSDRTNITHITCMAFGLNI